MAEGFKAMKVLRTAKLQLRSRIRPMLSSIPTESLFEQSEEAQATLLTLPEYKQANRLSIYLSMPKGEIFTRTIISDALRAGKRVFVPYIHTATSSTTHESKPVMTMVSLESKEDYESLRPDAWGIPTPGEATMDQREVIRVNHHHYLDLNNGERLSENSLDLIVIPGLAFDKRLARLGHGKGYYDVFLQNFHQLVISPAENVMPFLVGLALKEQVLPLGQAIPTDASDWPLDALIVGDGSIIRK